MNLSEFELAILRIVASFETGINWYGIAIRLSNINLPERPHQLETQKHLAETGLLYYETEKGLWHITEAGLSAISNSKSDME